MVMFPVVVLLWVVVVRLATIDAEFFVEALAGGGAFFTLVTFLIGRVYLRRREHDMQNGDSDL
jgi:hypothetical protein